MKRTRVKICGITRPEDARLAARLGADAIGVVFYAGSPRAVSVEQAAEIRAALPAMTTLVGLFVNPSETEVENVLQAVSVDCLQFHGEEPASFCQSFGIPYMKALRVGEGMDVEEAAAAYSGAQAILLDAYHPVQRGGTGLQFDWDRAAGLARRDAGRLVLAGGLEAGNVAQAINVVGPWAVDVSSGVEHEPGIKCPDKLAAFFQEVYRVQSANG